MADVALFGRGLHVTVADAGEALGRIRSSLERAGHPPERVEPVPPSLEDVFVAVARSSARDRAG